MQRIFILLSLYFLPVAVHAQITVVPNQTATVLANSLVGSCVTIISPTLTCAGAANGTFSGTSVLSFNNGIVLTTGSAANTSQPASFFSSVSNGTAGDAQLTALAGNPTYDACILQFDFQPAGDTIKFEYVFGSEEYNGFTCSNYNDVFGFFVSGPGIAGTPNIARIPGTNIPVCINSVNCGGGLGGPLSTCHALGTGSPFCAYYVNNLSGTNIVYDGLTKTLTAIQPVTPGGTYHLKIGIADVSDDIYDSGVFLNMGSFTSITAPASITGDTTLCLGDTITLSDPITGGTWSSSNTAIATVTSGNGMVSGVAAGVVTITYTTFCDVATATVNVTSCSVPINVPCYVSTSSLLAWYPFTGNAIDSSGNGNNGTVNGAILTTDRFGNPNSAYYYNGVNANISTSFLPPTGTAARSITCWFQFDSLLAPCQKNLSIVGYGANTAACSQAGENFSLELVWSVYPPNAVVDGVCTQTLASGPADTVNHNWHFFAATYDPSSGTYFDSVKLYLDGHYATTSYYNPNTILNTGSFTDLLIGMGHYACPRYWNGKIDDIGVWGRALTPCELSKLYHSSCVSGVITGSAALCQGTTIALSDVSAGGTWNSGNATVATIDLTSGVVMGVSPGVSVISYSTSCGTIATTTVTISAVPSPISGITNVCAGLTTQLSDAVNAGTWSSQNTAIATINSSGTVTGIAAGSAVISYATSSSCVATITVTVNATPVAITGASNICEGSTTVLSSSPGGGTWSSSNTGVATISSTGVVSGFATGSVIITYSLTGGCFMTSSLTISQPPQAISGITNVCAGSTTQLSDTTSGGTWNSSNVTVATVTPTGLVTGVAGGTAVISYSTGCAVVITVTVNPTPSVISGNTNICVGAASNLISAPGGGTWSSSNTNVAMVTPSGTVSGTTIGSAIITYALSGGCFKTTTITVSQPPPAITGITNICSGAATLLSDPAGGGVWSSSNTNVATISPSGLVTGVAAGNTVIFYSTGCAAYITVTVNPTPSIIAGNSNICVGATSALSSAPGGGVWTSGNIPVATITSAGLVSGVMPGSAIITYSLPGGCYRTATVTISQPPQAITGIMNVCAGSSTNLSDSSPGGVWSSSSTTIATVSPSGSVTGITAGIVSISYSTGCATIATVTVNPSPSAIIGAANICLGSAVILSSSPGNGTWSSSNTSVATIATDGTVGSIATGSAIVTYLLPAGCFSTATLNIIPTPSEISGTMTVCAGATITLSNSVSGGVWSSGTPAVASVNSGGIVTGISGGAAIISYSINGGCTVTVTVTVFPAPPITPIVGPDMACPDAVFSLSDATQGGSWSNNNPTVLSINSTGQVSAYTVGTAIITYTTGPTVNGCISVTTDTVTISFQGTFTVDSTITPVTCYGANNGSIYVTVNGGTQQYQYFWYSGVNGPSISGLASGYDTLSIKEEATQCLEVLTFHISQPDSLSAVTDVKNDLCYSGTGSISVTVTGGTTPYNYRWSNNAAGYEITGLIAGQYSVVITDSNSCIKNISAKVDEDTCSDIIIHNAITPNGDGYNDTWVIENIKGYPSNTVQVFDKWGDMVYEKANYQNDWGGKGKDGLLPDGTYYYLVKLNTASSNGGQNVWTGSLLIKR